MIEEHYNIIARNCKEIECLTLIEALQCSDSDYGFEAMGHAFGKSLKHDNITDVSDLTDDGFRNFLKMCPNLEKVYIGNCYLLNGESFASFGSKLQQLYFMEMNDMPNCVMSLLVSKGIM